MQCIRFIIFQRCTILSANAATPIEGDEMSILGYELDALQLKMNVQFVISSGNHQLWSTESSLENILDDDDSRVSAPADSMLSIVVGATSGETHPNSLSSVNEITSYSRRGPGFNGFSKPDITAYEGSITYLAGSVSVPEDRYSLLLDKNGKLTPDAGTSFTAPVVAKVSVTCVSMPPVDRTKGTEYLGAYIRASLKKGSSDGRLKPVQQDFKEGRQKWDVCHQFTKLLSKFEVGDWQIWLELFSRWDKENIDVPYALAVTIEDVSNTLDVYSEIEALNRYRAINTLRLRVDAQA